MTGETERKACLHAIVEGRVQGVGFRYFVEEVAVSLGLSGWVRNRWDGSVEVTAEGSRAMLDKLYLALQHGPRAATVTQVQVDWSDATGASNGFVVRSTV
jgi:acylphosphatase